MMMEGRLLQYGDSDQLIANAAVDFSELSGDTVICLSIGLSSDRVQRQNRDIR